MPGDRNIFLYAQIWIRSPSKAHGYWGLPERSRETFCAIPAPPNASESTVETHSDPIVEGAETPQSVAVAGETIGTPPEMAPGEILGTEAARECIYVRATVVCFIYNVEVLIICLDSWTREGIR